VGLEPIVSDNLLFQEGAVKAYSTV